MKSRQRRVAACALFLAWAVLGLAHAAPAPDTGSIDSPGSMELSAMPSFQDCSAWSEISAGDAEVQALHTQMCQRSGPSAAPAPAEATPYRTEEVQATPEDIAEAIPVAQQNFALIRDGAKIIASNSGAKKVAGILDDDSDTFMRNDCRDDKWVVFELSQVAKVSRVELAQHELYSSRVKEFEVRGRQTHPRTDGVDPSKALNSTAWKLVGRFTAERAKGVQNFAAERPIWARFLLVRFLTHYGAEPVCAVNGLAVYGKSAAEELEDQLAEDLEDLLAEEGSGMEGKEGAGAVPAAERIAQALAAGVEVEGGGAGELKDGRERGEGEEKGSGAEGPGASASDAATPSPAPAPAPVEPASGSAGAPSASADAAELGAAAPAPAPAPAQLPSGKAADGATPPNTTATTPEETPTQQDKKQQQQKAAAEAKVPTSAAGAATGDTGPAPSPTASDSAVPTTTSTNAVLVTIPDATAAPAAADAANVTAAAAAIPITPATTPATVTPADAMEDTFELLPVPKTKAGGGIYEALVQEIRVAKAAQRQSAKALDALQRNVTALAIALTRITTEYQVSESELAARVDAMMEARLAALHGRVVALGDPLDRAGKREHAALSLLAMLGGALAVSLRGMEAKRWPRARAAVVALALANGAVGVALHYRSAR